MIEENPTEDQSVRPAQASQLPGRTLTTEHDRRNARPVASSSAGQTHQKDRARAEEDFKTIFSRPMSHLSAAVPPLNLGQHPRGSLGGFYAFQTPASPRPDPRGGPGILVQAQVGQVNHPSIVNSFTSPTVLNNSRPRNSTAPQPEVHLGTHGNPPLSRSDPTTHNVQSVKSPPRTPPTRTAFTGSQRARQSAPKIGSPLRESHPYIPYNPRDVGSPSTTHRPPRPQGPRGSTNPAQTSTTGDTLAHQTRVDVSSAAIPQENQRTTSGQQHNREAQEAVEDTHPSTFETHVVRFREPDLAGLIASGVIKVNPESRPPEWMLKYAPRFSSHKAGVQVVDNTERRTVKLRRSLNSVRRSRSHRAEIEIAGHGGGSGGGGSRRYFSNDSGYCTASSSGLLSTLTLDKRSRSIEKPKIWCEEPAPPSSWSQASSAFSSQTGVRALRRRSSVPELDSCFRLGREKYEHEGDEEEDSQASLRDGYVWEERGPLG